jgi:predicted nucleic acid-binding protein
MIVIADSGPLRYLVLIEEASLLNVLYGGIVIPPGVVSELTQPDTPQSVRIWMEQLPAWIVVRSPSLPLPIFPSSLGLGECEAIALAEELHADALLVDDEAARIEASRRNIPIQGTLGILDLAAEHGFADLSDAIQRLQRTNFRASRKLIQFFLDRDAQRKKQKVERGE